MYRLINYEVDAAQVSLTSYSKIVDVSFFLVSYNFVYPAQDLLCYEAADRARRETTNSSLAKERLKDHDKTLKHVSFPRDKS